MSRDLPLRPNLEHLKNQARVLLRGLQRDDPAARLADALHAVAREYGFASWPLLKAHVESLPAAPADHPLTGTWAANVADSQRHPLHYFRSATVRFEVADDVVTIDHVAIDSSGQPDRDTNVVRVNGEEHPVAHGITYVARWRGRRALEVEARRHAQVTGRAIYEVSADGRRLFITSAEQRIVLDRVSESGSGH
jgi:hypothetical protein